VIKLRRFREITSTQGIEQLFRQAAKEVWRNSDIIDQIEIKVVIGNFKAAMSVLYPKSARPMAMGDSLLQAPTYIELHIDNRAFDYTSDQFYSLLKHEAIHLGYQKHDRGFFDLADKVGAPRSELMAKGDGKPYKLMKKRRGRSGRFELLKDFDNEKDAREYGMQFARQHPDIKVVLRF
jgi:hypothetical protein